MTTDTPRTVGAGRATGRRGTVGRVVVFALVLVASVALGSLGTSTGDAPADGGSRVPATGTTEPRSGQGVPATGDDGAP